MPTLLDQLKQSPRLPDYLREMEALMEDESRKRKTFYKQAVEDKKMEFINGEVVFQSPVKLRHAEVSQLILRLMQTFVEIANAGFVGHKKMLISLTRNDYEPDICYWRTEKSANFTATQMQFPAPDLVVEVLSPSTEERDRGVKFVDYAAHGVVEYWLVDPEKQTVEQYLLVDESYQIKHRATNNELVYCQAISGFIIPAKAIFDTTENLNVLRNLLSD